MSYTHNPVDIWVCVCVYVCIYVYIFAANSFLKKVKK